MRRALFGIVVTWLAVQGCSGSSESKNPESTKPPELVPVRTEFDDVGAAATCDVNDDSQNCLEAGDNTIRIDDEVKLQFKGGDLDPAKNIVRLELQPGAKLDPRFKEGAFIYRGRKDRKPLLHRIDALRVDGSKVEAKLSPARPKDAFKRGRVRVRIPLGAEGPNNGGTRAQSRPLMRDGLLGTTAQALTIPPIGPQDCSGTVLSGAVAAVGGTGTVDLNFTTCRFVLTAWVDATLRWDSAVNLDKLEVTVGGSVDAALHAKLEASVTGAGGQSKTIWTFPDIPIVVAGLVLTLTPKIEAGWDITGKATLSVEQGFDYTGSIEEGFGWSDRKGWYSVDERTSTFSKFGPTVTFDGSVTATAWIRPRVDLQAFGIVGGYVALKTFAEGVITSTGKIAGNTVSGEICTDLSVGIQPTVGASADLFGIKLFDENVVLATFKQKLVNDACIPYTGPIPTDCDLSSPCCNDGQCTPPTEAGVTVQCEKGLATSGGKFKYKCVQHYPKNFCLTGGGAAGDVLCDDKNSVTIDKCVDNLCENTLPGYDNLPPNVATETKQITLNCSKLNPECCFSTSDCADGNPINIDTCTKAAGAGPEVSGTCTHTEKKIIVGGTK